MRETAPMMEKPKRGRPRIWSPDAPAQVLQQLMESGKPEVCVPELIEALMAEVGCSRRSAYRLLRAALDQGALKIGTTHSGTN